MYSAWNIGEVIGALDERHQRGRLTDPEYTAAILNFSEETLHTSRAGLVKIVPVAGKLLTQSWQILQRAHIYEADALQIVSCKDENCDIFLAEDRRLRQTAKAEGLNSLDPSKDEKHLLSL